MAMTEFGPNHPLSVRLWAKRLFVESIRETFIDRFIANIEDTDIGEAVTKLNQDQLALESSFRVFSQLNSLSLLNFI